MMITEEVIKRRFDFEDNREKIHTRLHQDDNNPFDLLMFMSRYSSWNSIFGACVATLAGKVGLSKAVFKDHNFPIGRIADRSVLIGSYFFDAARDEFDDRDNPARDTHRCLSQAFLTGIIEHYKSAQPTFNDMNFIDHILTEPAWLDRLSETVEEGYGASDTDRDPHTLFFNMGYHLGSEALADQEFTMIDQYIREQHPALAKFLMETEVTIAGEKHNCYHWVKIHSGFEAGGGVENEHYLAAVEGINKALEYKPKDISVEDALDSIFEGFDAFVDTHMKFFSNV